MNRDPLSGTKHSHVLRSVVHDKLDIDLSLMPRHPLLTEASKLIRTHYAPRPDHLVQKSTEKELAQIRMRSQRERDSHIGELKCMSDMNPRLRGFFWAPDLSYAAFAPAGTIKAAQEKWELQESRLDLMKSPETNV